MKTTTTKANDQVHEKALATMRAAVSRILALELDVDAMHARVTVPPPPRIADMDPKLPLHQKQFLADNGVTKVERATLDYLAAGELRGIVGGELAIEVEIADAEETRDA